MPEPTIPPEAEHAVLVHPWGDGPRSAHIDHKYEASCAVGRGDVAAILAVAAPHIAEHIAHFVETSCPWPGDPHGPCDYAEAAKAIREAYPKGGDHA